MKFNQWTLGLAAVGLVSLTSAAKADEAKMSSVATALSSTTLSGYVDTSAQWNLGSGVTHAPGYGFGGATKADGFNLNVVDLNLEKDPDAADGWGAGYKIELWLGPDANALGSQAGAHGDFAVKNAYVDLKAPVGNGIDFKVGVFDTPIGYEVADSPNNPNFTRSWGFTIEPTTHTGVLASYTICDEASVWAGIADTFGAGINGRAVNVAGATRESYKAYMGGFTLTAPKDWGWVAGSTLSGGIINGFNGGSPAFGGAAADQTSYYAGLSMNTPLTQLKVGAAFDYVDVRGQGLTAQAHGYANAGSLYATWQATEKLSANSRIEYASYDTASAVALSGAVVPFGGGLAPAPTSAVATKMLSLTETVQYDLWKNVLSRLEFRWDHALDGNDVFGGSAAGVPGATVFGSQKDSFEIIGNIVYKF